MHRTTIAILALVLAAGASVASLSSCAEATDGVTPPTPVPASSDGAIPEAGPAPTDGAAPSDAKPVTASAVLLNEIAAGEEWVELVNAGSAAIDVSGFRVADSEKDGGAPKLSDAVTFPPGTILSPKSYIIVQGGGLDGGGKPAPDGGQSYAFNAEFGISNKNGETLYLVDTGGAVVGSAIYPPMAAPAGATWGRLPSGDPSGSFAVTAPTPGATNQAK